MKVVQYIADKFVALHVANPKGVLYGVVGVVVYAVIATVV